MSARQQFTRVKAGLHRAQLPEGSYELRRDPSAKTRFERQWTLFQTNGHEPVCLDSFIKTVAEGEDALRFIIQVESYLRSSGAARSTYYRWILRTESGDLYISPHGDRIMMRFEDVEAAKKGSAPTRISHTGFNPYSGKWNMHWATGHPAEAKLREFTARIELLM